MKSENATPQEIAEGRGTGAKADALPMRSESAGVAPNTQHSEGEPDELEAAMANVRQFSNELSDYPDAFEAFNELEKAAERVRAQLEEARRALREATNKALEKAAKEVCVYCKRGLPLVHQEIFGGDLDWYHHIGPSRFDPQDKLWDRCSARRVHPLKTPPVEG